MNYRDTLEYIFQKLPLFSRIGSAAYKKDLTNIRALCGHLGNPEQKIKTIHVAGTNGKGSVSHMLAAIFQTAGYKTGLYTSPHLYDFRERIRLNGEMIPEDYVTSFVERLKPQIETIEPSFFEITVAMAMQFFAEEQVDIAIIEVGLGGRLDSTNIIIPELAVITNIGWDHMNLLGNTLPAIAGEKAGIIKPDIPVVIGETVAETKPVFQRVAAEKNAPVYWAEELYTVRSWQLQPFVLSVELSDQTNRVRTIHTDLPGIYQVQNVRTVLAAIDVLNGRGWTLPDAAVSKALQNVKRTTGLGGRWEVISQHPTVVLEVAHNPQGMGQMMAHLQQTRFQQLHIVIGIVKDKEAEDVLRLLPADATYYFTQAQIPRALPAGELARVAARFQLKGDQYVEVNSALQAALQAAGSDDFILVCGSIFLVAEVDKSQYVNSPRRANA